MNDANYIEELFVKLVDNQLTKEEYDTFITIVKRSDSKEKLQQLLDEYLQSEQVLQKHESTSERNAGDVEKLYRRVIQKIETKHEVSHPKKRSFILKKIASPNFYRTAAVIILLGGFLYLNQNNFFIKKDDFKVHEDVTSTPSDEEGNITLKLANGEVMILSGNGQKNILGAKSNLVASQNGSKLNYTKRDDYNKIQHNELSVPYGKRFELVLTDGTQVTLNAGSWIKYPVQFTEGASRTVFLKGEAYFDVVPDDAHPFIVNTDAISVEVLGTQFYLSNFPEDSHINTVLVEGSVKVYEKSDKDNKTSSMVLTPGHLAAWSNKEKKMTVEKVDVSMYIDWRNGILKFKNSSFHNIIKQLERHFDVRIENHNEFLERQIYTATFREESIIEILNAFKEDTPFEYKVDSNHITILKKN